MTDAHEQTVTIRFIERWPAHEPRESDPHYKAFNRTKRRMKKLGLLRCAIDSDYHHGPIELHHSLVEYAHIGDVDVEKFNRAYGLHLTDEQFLDYVEGPDGLEPLCQLHHRGQEGIHSLPEPQWRVLRVAKNHPLTALSNTEIGVIKEQS